MGISYYKEDVLRTFDVSREQGFAFLRNDSARRLENNSDAEETRGRKSLITPKQIREMDRILETEGIEGRGLTWSQLGYEIGLDCSGRTIQRAMGTMDYYKCLSCRRGWVNNKTDAHRVEWAQVMLNRYPESEDWHKVRFSDEVHYGWCKGNHHNKGV